MGVKRKREIERSVGGFCDNFGVNAGKEGENDAGTRLGGEKSPMNGERTFRRSTKFALDTAQKWYTIYNKGDQMTRINSRIVLPIVTAAVGVLWIYVGLTYHGWYIEERPASGFFPSIVGVLLTFVSVLAVIKEMREDPPEFWVSHIHPLLAAVSVVVFALLIGFFPALTAYVFAWLKWYEKYSWKFSVATTAVTIAAVYGIFSMWLRVPFPVGWIIEMVQN